VDSQSKIMVVENSAVLKIMVAEKAAGVWIANRKSNSGVASAL